MIMRWKLFLKQGIFFIIRPIFKKTTKSQYLGAIKPKDIHSYFKNLKPIKKEKI